MKNKDLTVGNPSHVLWLFCMPLFGSIIFQQLYNLADSFVAGKFIGESALAAVGNSYEITLIFIAFAFGCNVGCSVITSQLFGAKDYKNMKSAIYTSLISTGVLCAILMAFGFIFGEALLRLINTPDEIMADSLLYLNIYILGIPFVFYYNIATGIFSALGDSKTPFIFLALSSTANIFMDILFVTAFGMGISGVAWATFICQGVSCILALIAVLRRLSVIEVKAGASLFSARLLKKILIIAIPSTLQQSFISVGNIIIQGAINGFGTEVVAGYSASIKLNNLVITSLTTIGNGVSNFTAQNLGAGKYDRIGKGFFAGAKMVIMICVPFFAVYFLFGQNLTALFIDNPSTLSISTGKDILKILSPFYFIIALKLVADGILRGSGLMGRFMIATFTDLILRVSLAIILSSFLGAVGIWISWPIGWCVGTVLSIAFFKMGKWNKNEI